MMISIKVYASPLSVTVLSVCVFLLTSCATQEKRQIQSAAVKEKSSATTQTTAAKPANTTKSKSGAGRPVNKIYLGADGQLAGTGSSDVPAGEVYRIARSVHPKALSTPGLPKDKFGLIDWSRMVSKKIIDPADTVQGEKIQTPLLDLDVLIKTKGDFVNDVLFRHKPHVYWLDCKNCHTGIFVMAKGKNNMTMQGIVKGKWCGRCHGKASFPLSDCKRCHSKPKP